MHSFRSIALFIDADNAPIWKVDQIFDAVNARGHVAVKRAYGNFKKGNQKNWEGVIRRLAIKPEQQFDYVSGKNATDIALVIDAMDLLHTQRYDCFVIVSSDSDYTPLAIRLRESGAAVIGIGESKAPDCFQNACDEFWLLEQFPPCITSAPQPAALPEVKLLPLPEAEKLPVVKAKKKQRKAARNPDHLPPLSVEPTPSSPRSGETPKQGDRRKGNGRRKEEPDAPTAEELRKIHKILRFAFLTHCDQDGYAPLSRAGELLRRELPEFRYQAYGFDRLSTLLRAFPERYEMPDCHRYRCL